MRTTVRTRVGGHALVTTPSPTDDAAALWMTQSHEPEAAIVVLGRLFVGSAGRYRGGGEQLTRAAMLGPMNDQGVPVVYAIATGSSRAQEIGMFVDMAHSDGWDVCVVTSPSGRRFINVEDLTARTGWPVRSTYKDPGAPDVLPPADAS